MRGAVACARGLLPPLLWCIHTRGCSDGPGQLTLGALTGAQCRAQCEAQMATAGMSTGCWV
eukprot:gene851-15142_t